MLIRHLTLDEYSQNVVPIVNELKAIMRKKFFYNRYYGKGFEFFTHDQYVEMMAQRGKESFLNAVKNHYNVDLEDVEKALSDEHKNMLQEIIEKDTLEAKELLAKHGIKPNTKIPQGVEERFNEILKTLEPMFATPRIVDWSKAHKSHKDEVRYSIDSDGLYLQELLSEKLDFAKLEEICGSVGVKIPKRIYEFSPTQREKYKRPNLSPKNRAFIEAMETAISPYAEQIKLLKSRDLQRLLANYEASGVKSIFELKHKVSPSEFFELYSIVTKGWDVAVPKILNDFIEKVTFKFLSRNEEKLNIVNKNHGEPSVSISSAHLDFETITANLKLNYDSGLTLTSRSQIIVAQGEIQRIHLRYLTHYYKDGKSLSQGQIDSL